MKRGVLPVWMAFFVLFPLLLGGCSLLPSPSPTCRRLSLKTMLSLLRKDAPTCEYGGFLIRGSVYYFSPRRNFRGFFSLKGNTSFPWIMEIRWSMGNLVSIGRMDRDGCEVYVPHDNTVYRSRGLSPLFGPMGLFPGLSPYRLLDLLTGEWKETIPPPWKVLTLEKGGYELVFKGYFISRMRISTCSSLSSLVITLWPRGGGGYIRIFPRGKMEFISERGERTILRIKEISLFTAPLPLSELRVSFPPGAKEKWL